MTFFLAHRKITSLQGCGVNSQYYKTSSSSSHMHSKILSAEIYDKILTDGLYQLCAQTKTLLLQNTVGWSFTQSDKQVHGRLCVSISPHYMQVLLKQSLLFYNHNAQKHHFELHYVHVYAITGHEIPVMFQTSTLLITLISIQNPQILQISTQAAFKVTAHNLTKIMTIADS